MKRELEKKFQIKSFVFGPDADEGEKDEVTVLGRILQWHRGGVTYEADPRHAQKIIRSLNLEKAKGVTTPGTREDARRDEDHEEAQGGEAVTGAAATEFRGIVARANYLALDRPDIMYATKEASRRMSAPHSSDYRLLKRLGRYLVEKPRARLWYPWQEDTSVLDGYSDSDWAGCKATRKSTTGGIILRGSHFIKAYSRTQPNIALSSAEAELYALVRVSAEVMGAASMHADMGREMAGRIWADASAALGVVARSGIGKIRHLDTSLLWVQESAAREKLSYRKVAGENNVADLLTKYLAQEVIMRHSKGIGMEFRTDRASVALGIDHIGRKAGS